MEDLSPRLLAACGGFVIGLVFGAVVQRTNFCAMGAVSDFIVFRDGRRLRAWLLAIATAILGSQLLAALGLFDLRESIYLGSRLSWLGAILGGLLFGLGMVLAGGCGSRNLVRLGEGDLRSLVILLVLAISAAMAIHGLTAMARVQLNDLAAIELAAHGIESQSLAALLGGLAGGGAEDLRWAAALPVALGLAALCFASGPFRRSVRDIVAGLVLGLLVTAGWCATGVLGADDFEPERLASLTFVAPVGDSVLYLMTFTGSRLDFGIAVVGGVVLGAFASARLSGQFRLQSFTDRGDFLRNLLGAFLMGFGGVTALGCTIGQGITGLSTLALGSFLAFGAIFLGAMLGLHLLERYA